MVRAVRTTGGYMTPRERREQWQRSLIERAPETPGLDNPFYRPDFGGGVADDSISLEEAVEAENPPYVPWIDQKPLRLREVLGPRNPFQQAGLAINGVPQDTQPVADAFSGPASPLYHGRQAANEVNWQDYQQRQAGGTPNPPFVASPDGPASPLADIFSESGTALSGQSTQGVGDIFNGPPSPLSAISVSDRVRGNRYANMSKEDRDALNLTIAGEIDASQTQYGTPEADQEIANIVSTITNRAAETGTIHRGNRQSEDRQYSTWNDAGGRRRASGNLQQYGPEIRRATSQAITGDVMPTHTNLTHYLNREIANPSWARRGNPRGGSRATYLLQRCRSLRCHPHGVSQRGPHSSRRGILPKT